MAGVRQFDEAKVLERALALFRRKGLDATTMLDLATATRVQRGSLYNAYGDKETLFLLAFEGYAARLLERARAALARPDPRQALLAFFEVVLANMTAGSPALGCLTTRTATQSPRASRGVQQRLRRLLDELETLVLEALSSAEARRALALPPAESARVVVTFTRGLAVMERVYRDRRRLAQTAEALVLALLPAQPAKAAVGLKLRAPA